MSEGRILCFKCYAECYFLRITVDREIERVLLHSIRPTAAIDNICKNGVILSESSTSNPGDSHSSDEETVQSASPAGQAEVDAGAVRAAKQEIQGLVHEISELSRTDVTAEAFYGAMLDKVVQALAAVGGAVWALQEGSNTLQLQYQINLRNTGLPSDPVAQMQHGRLLAGVMKEESGVLVAPHSGLGAAAGGDENAPANPTDFLLVLSPVHNDQGPQGVIEIFQRPGTTSKMQRGYLGFLGQMCEFAGDFLKAQRLRTFAGKQTLWEQLEAFTRTAHQTLDVRQAAYSIANDGRKLIGCDRVTVAIQRGRKCKIEAVSGQDTFDKRSNVIALLERLATKVTATRDDVWYTGDSTDLAPQVEDALDLYIDESHTKAIAVLPLFAEQNEEETEEEDRHKPPTVVGALIVEQMVDSNPPEGLKQRVDIVRQHSGVAITNAIEHNSLFLMPLWKFIGKSRWLIQAKTLPKTILGVIALVALGLWLTLWQTDFTLEARGTLRPTIRSNVFAGIDGQVVKVLVHHNMKVQSDQTLAKLQNIELQKQLTSMQGSRFSSEKQLNSIMRRLQDSSQPLTPAEDTELRGDLAKLNATIASLKEEEAWLEKQFEMLEIKSNMAGTVTTWKVEERLQNRPVTRGQELLQIADTTGPWEIELMMPEHRMGHIEEEATKWKKENKGKLRVTFILALDPEKEHEGSVREIATIAEIRGEDGNTVLIRVDPKDQELFHSLIGLRPGAEVTAKVYCGKASVGYVWLHDLIGWVQSKVLFRF